MTRSALYFSLGFALCLAQAVAQEPVPTPAPPDPAQELERAIDLATPKERHAAAQKLAARKDVTLDQWLAIARQAGSFAEEEPGAKLHTVDLNVLEKIEPTELQVYVPSKYKPTTAHPLLMVFHGTGGSGRGQERFWIAAAEALSMLILAPSEAGANAGYAFSKRERAAAEAALRWARRRWNVDEDRIFLTGFSRGGHLAWDLALRTPDRYAALVPMVGGPRLHALGGQNNLRFMEQLHDLSIRDLQGALDDPGLIFNLKLAFAKLERAEARDARYLEFEDMGHSCDMTAVDWITFFGSARRNVQPNHVVRLAVSTAESRAFYVEITRLGKAVSEDIRPKVEASRWNAMTNDDKKRFLQDEADRQTARLDVKRTAPDAYEATGHQVNAFRLLLAESLFVPEKPVRVRFKSKERKLKPVPQARVLLEEFVERFDRRYLPVVELRIGS